MGTHDSVESCMHVTLSQDLNQTLSEQVKETLAAIQERAKVLGLQADALHLTRLAGAHARPLSVRKITMYSAAWVKSQVRVQRQLAQHGVCSEMCSGAGSAARRGLRAPARGASSLPCLLN